MSLAGRLYVAPLAVTLVQVLAPSALADTFSGHFPNEVIFLVHEEVSGGPEAMFFPDGAYEDLDGGGVTLGFSPSTTAFDYTNYATIPTEADLVLVDVGGIDEPRPDITFGYVAMPEDANADGIADGLTGSGVLLEDPPDLIFPPEAPWDNDQIQALFYYDLDGTFVGVTPTFVLAIDDQPAGDFDVNSVHVIPEPNTIVLLLFIAPALARRW